MVDFHIYHQGVPQYIMVVYDHNTNAILGKLLKSRQEKEIANNWNDTFQPNTKWTRGEILHPRPMKFQTT